MKKRLNTRSKEAGPACMSCRRAKRKFSRAIPSCANCILYQSTCQYPPWKKNRSRQKPNPDLALITPLPSLSTILGIQETTYPNETTFDPRTTINETGGWHYLEQSGDVEGWAGAPPMNNIQALPNFLDDDVEWWAEEPPINNIQSPHDSIDLRDNIQPQDSNDVSEMNASLDLDAEWWTEQFTMNDTETIEWDEWIKSDSMY